MKKTITLLLTLCSYVVMSQSLHSFAINDIDGNTVSLSSYQGKKVLIFIAPLNSGQMNMLTEIDSLQILYGDSVRFIGIMSKEDGYIDSNKASIKNLYATKGINILLTEGMYTKKAQGVNQGQLLYWLTTKTLNQRFAIDAGGIGQKFFINKQGKLFEVLPKEIPFLSPLVASFIQRRA